MEVHGGRAGEPTIPEGQYVRRYNRGKRDGIDDTPPFAVVRRMSRGRGVAEDENKRSLVVLHYFISTRHGLSSPWRTREVRARVVAGWTSTETPTRHASHDVVLQGRCLFLLGMPLRLPICHVARPLVPQPILRSGV